MLEQIFHSVNSFVCTAKSEIDLKQMKIPTRTKTAKRTYEKIKFSD